jgi:hypothetical protein
VQGLEAGKYKYKIIKHRPTVIEAQETRGKILMRKHRKTA